MCAKNFIVSLFNRLVNHNVIMHIGITIVAASNTATDDVRSEWVEFNAPLDTIQVISEAEDDVRK